MERKELTINIPNGYEIDEENSTFKKIIFKSKTFRPRSWEEYCNKTKWVGYYIDNYSNIEYAEADECYLRAEDDKNLLPTKELAESFLAMMQLMSLRQVWIKDWTLPSNPSNTTLYYCLVSSHKNIHIQAFSMLLRPLSFPTKEMAEQFFNCFKDLIKKAKLLI